MSLDIKFDTSVLHDPKIILKITKSHSPRIFSTEIPPNLRICFALRPTVFELHAILKHMHPITIRPWNTIRPKAPHICSTRTPESQIRIHLGTFHFGYVTIIGDHAVHFVDLAHTSVAPQNCLKNV